MITQADLPPELREPVALAERARLTPDIAAACYRHLDLTSLNDADTERDLEPILAKAAVETIGRVAAFCTWPKFVKFSAFRLEKLIPHDPPPMAFVVNFPKGANLSAEQISAQTHYGFMQGAREVDLVVNYMAFQDGNTTRVLDEVRACAYAAKAQGGIVKAILETPQLTSGSELMRLAELCAPYVDFFKTGTGRGGAVSMPEAALLIEAARLHRKGVKISSGLNADNIAQFYNLVLIQSGSVDPTRFRFGASSVADDLIRMAHPNDANVTALRAPPRPQDPHPSTY